MLAGEAGGHRVQRVPPTERRGRVHTSTVTVATFSDMGITGSEHPAAQRGSDDYRIEWYSGSGAGGQHRNKHQNSARVTHIPTGVVRTAQTRKRESSLREAMTAVDVELDAMCSSHAGATENASRRDQVGSGMRGDKRRTYRFQDDRVVDHITGRSAKAGKVIGGRLDLVM